MILKEFIICSAIHFKNGAKSHVENIDSGIIICGRRHRDCYNTLYELVDYKFTKNAPEPERENQGFMTSYNRYVTRKEAFKIAKENNQIIHNLFDDVSDGSLASEYLYGID